MVDGAVLVGSTLVPERSVVAAICGTAAGDGGTVALMGSTSTPEGSDVGPIGITVLVIKSSCLWPGSVCSFFKIILACCLRLRDVKVKLYLSYFISAKIWPIYFFFHWKNVKPFYNGKPLFMLTKVLTLLWDV